MPYRSCDYCRKAYYTRPSALKQGFGRYCSKPCSNRASNPAKAKRIPQKIEDKIIAAYLAGQSKREAGERYGYGRGGAALVLKRRGIQARTVSQALTGRIVSAETKARISASHHNVAGSNNPMHGRPPGHGKSVYVDHLGRRVRSTWEATIALALHTLSIRYEYEAHRFRFSNGKTYLPDFYLPDFDIFVEVKGWKNFRSNHSLALMDAEYPDVRLLLVGPEEYRAIVTSIDALSTFVQEVCSPA